jgi:hypothetical protein
VARLRPGPTRHLPKPPLRHLSRRAEASRPDREMGIIRSRPLPAHPRAARWAVAPPSHRARLNRAVRHWVSRDDRNGCDARWTADPWNETRLPLATLLAGVYGLPPNSAASPAGGGRFLPGICVPLIRLVDGSDERRPSANRATWAPLISPQRAHSKPLQTCPRSSVALTTRPKFEPRRWARRWRNQRK